MLLRKTATVFAVQRQLLLPAKRNPNLLNPVRFKWISGREATETNQMPVGTKLGHPEDPETHTWDGEYRGTPEKGDTLIPE